MNDRQKGFRPPSAGVGEQLSAAEYWKPEVKGEALAGVVKRRFSTRFGDNLSFGPCITYHPQDYPHGFGELAVGMNASLRAVLEDAEPGQCYLIGFVGRVETPKGEMRSYRVRPLTRDAWLELVRRDTPEMAEMSKSDTFPENLDADADDDLPF